MKITGDDLIKMFYTSMTDDEMVELIDKLGLEQPLLDEKYEFYEETSTTDSNNIGIDFTFYKLDKCAQIEIPCFDKISWDNDKVVKLPFGLKYSLSYNECCDILGKKADYQDKLGNEMKMWIIKENNLPIYILAIDFKNENLLNISGVVVLAYRNSKINKSFIENKD